MCGLCGFAGTVEPGDEARVRKARTALSHRGPDSQGDWSWHDPQSGSGVIFGHTRLSILDLRGSADQPMVHEPTGLCMVFNGEIYNFKQLRSELIERGHHFRTTGDSEVILNGFVEWGAAVVQRLRGMFAMVIFDPRNRTLFLARDGYGIKPLYYVMLPGQRGIAFASEVRSLLDAEYAPRKTDHHRLRQYLWNGFMPSPGTIICDIECFPPGSTGEYDLSTKQLRIQQSWSLSGAASRSTSPQQAETSLDESVRGHLVSDVPLGVFLSGGIDSTAVAVMAARNAAQVKTLSIGFREEGSDETVYAERAAKQIKSDHTTIRISGSDMLGQIDATVSALDQPSFDGINTWFVSRAAVEAGLKVALAGTGGDELFGGYSSFRRLPRLHRNILLAKGFPNGLGLARYLYGPYTNKRKLASLASTRGDLRCLYQLQYAMFDPDTVGRFMGQHAPASRVRWGLDEDRFDRLGRSIEKLSPLQSVSYLESQLFLSDRLLRDTDSASMAHSLEVRVPLVDTVLADSCWGMSDESRFLPLGTKPPLSSIAASGVDRSVFERKKQGFEFPFDHWFQGELRSEISSIMLDHRLILSSGLNPKAVGDLWESYLANPKNIYWTRVWTVYALLKWFSIYNITI